MGIRFNNLQDLLNHSQKPSTIEMAKNLGKSAVEWAASGFAVCDGEELKNRLKICFACEHQENNRCLKCGCFIEAKTRLGTSKCPIGKWQSLTQS